MLGAGDTGRSRAVEHHAHAANFFADNLERVQQRRSGNDRRAMLVIVEDGNLQRLLQRLLNVKAIRRLDVFQVDAPEGGLQKLAEFDDLVGIMAVHLDVEDIHVGEALEQHSLAFHHGLAGKSADIPETKHGGSVADHRDQVALRGVFVCVLRIVLNLEAGIGHSGRVCQAKVALRAAWFRRGNFNFPRARTLVVVQGLLLGDWHTFLRNFLSGHVLYRIRGRKR